MGTGVFLGGKESVLELDIGDGCTVLWLLLKNNWIVYFKGLSLMVYELYIKIKLVTLNFKLHCVNTAYWYLKFLMLQMSLFLVHINLPSLGWISELHNTSVNFYT